MDDPPRRSLQVDAAPIGRRRSPIAALAVMAALASFLTLALVKPWAPGSATGPPGVTAEPAAATSDPAAGAPTATAPPVAPTASPAPPSAIAPAEVTDADLLAVARPRSGWGVRAIIVPAAATEDDPAAATEDDPAASSGGAHLGIEERWTPIPAPSTVSWYPPPEGTAAFDEGPVVAIGVTTPADELPLDVRFWRMEDGGIPERVVPLPVPGPDPGSWLWRPGPGGAWSGPAGTWRPGRYRVDVLTGPEIVRLGVVVPGAEGFVSDRRAAATLPADLAAVLAPLDAGLFVIADGVVTGIDGVAHDTSAVSVTERDLWLLPGIDRPLATVPQFTSRDVVAIGVVLPADARSAKVDLRLIEPLSGSVIAPVVSVPLGPDGERGTAAIAHADGVQPFGGGTYRVWASWADSAGVERASIWFLDIVPLTPAESPASPLAALRRWNGRAQVPGGTAGEPIVTQVDLRPSGDHGTCGGGALVPADAPLLALAAPPGPPIVSVQLFAPDGYTRIDARAALDVADGLSIVALPGGGLIPGRYRIQVTRNTGTEQAPATEGTSYDVCIGG